MLSTNIVSLGNGTIDFSEFVAMMSTKIREVNMDDEIRDAFKVFDQVNRERWISHSYPSKGCLEGPSRNLCYIAIYQWVNRCL